MWTEITRRQYRREGLGYASDMTAAEWSILTPLPPPARRLGRPRRTDPREVLNAILYVLATDTQGLPLAVLAHPANLQDVHGAVPL